MDFGASMFFTDYSMSAAELAQALEARGFELIWAPEHSHIPTSRRSPYPGGGDLPKAYYDAMDPFVTLTAAAMATKTLKIGTGVCLVNQRDTIQTAKLVASIDQVSGGRFLFGIGIGWNAEEMEDHGTAFTTRAKLVRERVEAMKLIWTKTKAEYHGELVDFPEMMAWPKPVQKPHPPVIVGGAYPAGGAACGALRRRLDPAGRKAEPVRRRVRLRAQVPGDAEGGRARRGVLPDHAVQRAGGRRPAEALPRPGRRAGQRQPAGRRRRTRRCRCSIAGPS